MNKTGSALFLVLLVLSVVLVSLRVVYRTSLMRADMALARVCTEQYFWLVDGLLAYGITLAEQDEPLLQAAIRDTVSVPLDPIPFTAQAAGYRAVLQYAQQNIKDRVQYKFTALLYQGLQTVAQAHCVLILCQQDSKRVIKSAEYSYS